MNKPFKGLDLDPAGMTQVYGLGQQFQGAQGPNCRFVQTGADGDRIAHGVREGLVVNGVDAGNGFQGFQCAAVGNVQIPVLYAARRRRAELRALHGQRLQAALGLHG